MSRYVDAEYVKAVMLNDRLMQGNAEFTLYVQQVETHVNALPGIDIVRCSECKHWRTYETWSECELWTDDFWYLFLNDATAHPRYVYAWMPLPEPWKGADDE